MKLGIKKQRICFARKRFTMKPLFGKFLAQDDKYINTRDYKRGFAALKAGLKSDHRSKCNLEWASKLAVQPGAPSTLARKAQQLCAGEDAAYDRVVRLSLRFKVIADR